MGIVPKAPKVEEFGGSDIKRLQVDENMPQETKDGFPESRYKPNSLVEEFTAGSFLAGKGTNSIEAKDPEKTFGVTVADCTPPGRMDIEGSDPYSDAV